MGNYGNLLLTARSADAVSDVSLEEIASSSTCGFAVRNSGERRLGSDVPLEACSSNTCETAVTNTFGDTGVWHNVKLRRWHRR